MTSGAGQVRGRSGSETGRFTARRLRSALSSWRASIRGTDILVASVLVALSLGLGAYLLARAQAAAHLAFAQRAQRLQAAVTERLSLPSEDLSTLQSLLEASGQVTRRQFRHLTDRPCAVIGWSTHWSGFRSSAHRSAPLYEAEARLRGPD